MNNIKTIACVLVCLWGSQANADWLRFLGPNGSGISESSVPVSWTPDANVAWKAGLPGPGVSSPIVVGDLVFVTCYSGYGLDRENPGNIENLKRHLVCFDAVTGDKKWQRDVDADQPEDPFSGIGVTAHGYASHTPVSDGERVYAYFGKSGAFAFDLDGEQLWHRKVGHESDPWAWGSASSPIVVDDLVIITASAESQSMVGLDKLSGEEVWRQEAAGLDGMWGTPSLVKVRDGRTDLVMSVAREIWGLDPSSGMLRWYCQATGAEQAHSSPVSDGETVYAFTGRGGGSVAVKAGGEGDVTDSNVIWTGRDSSRFGSPVHYKGHLYLVSNGVVTMIDSKSGKKLGQVRMQGGGSGGGRSRFGSLNYASPVVTGDKLYYVNGKGETFVFSLVGVPKQLSINLVTTETETFGGSPAVSHGRMFLRSNKHLYCVADAGADIGPNASADLIAKASPAEQQGDSERRGGFRGGGGFDPAAIFNRRDENKDGKLTVVEVAGSPMAERFAALDKDGDKAISMEEFRSAMRNAFGGGRRGGRGGVGRPGGRDDKRPKRPQRPRGVSVRVSSTRGVWT